MPNLIFDAHLDLSMNAMEWNRDLSQPISEIRKREIGMNDKPDREKGTVSFGEMRKGRVGLCVATMIARYVAPDNPLPGWHSQEQAWAQTRGQLAWYRAMEKINEMVQIKNKTELKHHVSLWENAEKTNNLPLGYILSLEDADSVIDMHHLEIMYQEGLRALGPAHYGPGVYAYGTDESEGKGITSKGKELLKKMEELNIILDATHLCDKSFWEALDHFQGPVWASHNNCRALVSHNRQFSDEQIKALIGRGAVIGAAFDAWMLVPNWIRRESTPENTGVSLTNVVDNIDHVCQIAGNTLHSGLGTDLDGGFGREQSPLDLNTIADLQKITELLKARGYSSEDIQNIMSKNWIAFLERNLEN